MKEISLNKIYINIFIYLIKKIYELAVGKSPVWRRRQSSNGLWTYDCEGHYSGFSFPFHRVKSSSENPSSLSTYLSVVVFLLEYFILRLDPGHVDYILVAIKFG